MKDPQIFKNSQFGEVRVTTTDNNEPLFCLADLCKILGLESSTRVKSRLDKKGLVIIDLNRVPKSTGVSTSMIGNSMATFINESNFYKVVFQSRKKEAEQFTEWVTSEVLPSIRKHGAYMSESVIEKTLSDPDFLIRLATELKNERAEKELAQAKVTKMEPKALFADAVIASEKSCLVGELAKILKQNGIEIGQNKLFIWLRDKSYLGTKGEYRNLPTQKAMNLGLFKIKKSTKELNNGSILLCTTTTVTAKGQIYFINKFLDRKKKRLLRKNKNPQKNKPDLLF